MIDSFIFLVKCAVKSIFKNWILTLASVTVLTICLVTLGSSILLFDNVNLFIDEVGDESQVVIFLDESLTTEQINGIHQQLFQIQNIKNVSYESKEMALQNYLESMGENASLFSDVTSDVLRNSFIFNIKDLSKFDQTIFEVEKIEGISRIRERREVVDRINDISQVILMLAFWIIAIFIVISILVITNTVKVSVYSRRIEINIMKYVGATDAFIQMPYFIEGIIIGILAGILTLILTYFTYTNILSPIIYDFGLFTPVSFQSRFIPFALFYIVSGALIGMVGSVYPVKKYLNV